MLIISVAQAAAQLPRPFPARSPGLSAPTLVSVEGSEATDSDNLTWTDGSPGYTRSFQIWYSYRGGPWQGAANVGSGVTTYEFATPLDDFSNYSFMVSAVGLYGDMLHSNPIEVAPYYGFSDLSAQWLGAGECIRLTWTAASALDYLAGIEIYRDSGSGYELIDSIDPTQTTWDDCNVVTGTSYSYKIRTFNSGGYGPFGNVATSPVLLRDAGDDLLLDAGGAVVAIPR